MEDIISTFSFLFVDMSILLWSSIGDYILCLNSLFQFQLIFLTISYYTCTMIFRFAFKSEFLLSFVTCFFTVKSYLLFVFAVFRIITKFDLHTSPRSNEFIYPEFMNPRIIFLFDIILQATVVSISIIEYLRFLQPFPEF